MSRPIALVTGASAGIGRAFAEQLAARGHDLVVVARDTARLEALAKELDAAARRRGRGAHRRPRGGDGIAAVEARLVDEHDPVDLLVNNAGFGTVGRFHELPISTGDLRDRRERRGGDAPHARGAAGHGRRAVAAA